MVYTTDALILKSVDSGEHDRLLTLLSPKEGKFSVIAKGGRSPRSRLTALTQPFVYGNFEIYKKGDIGWLKTGSVTEYFSGVRGSIEKLALSAYICDIASEITGEGVPAIDILRMTLNTLYALGRELCPDRQIKAVYEIRAAGYAGYMPDITKCKICGDVEPELSYLDVPNGSLCCSRCLAAGSQKPLSTVYDDLANEKSLLVPLSSGSLSSLRYALRAMPERMFSFRVTDDKTLEEFSKAAETYLLNHLERGFDSLEFYNTIAG